ncbi:MAG: helix-turn-helix domain-containing protein [Thermus sp.]|uniref:helix-turn-helix domain-containing protein n=1 Tax=Thermus sp. TaxID=275 RepID=UPI00351BD1EE
MPRRKQPQEALPPRIRAIIERRKELGLTQEELARMAGFSFSLMAKIERGATDPRSLSALYLTNLARVLGLPLSVLLDEGLPEGLEERRPVALPLYPSLQAALSGESARQAYLAPEDLPKGALVDKLAFLELPGPWLFSLTLPFPLTKPVRLLAELRPLVAREGVYVGRLEGHPALFTHEDLERKNFALYPLLQGLPTLWTEGREPEILGLVRGWWVQG